MRPFFLALLLFTSITYSQFRQLSISGKVISKSSKSPISNCNISVIENSRGTVTDSSGSFVLYMPQGKFHIKFSHIGYKTKLLDFEISAKVQVNNLLIEMDLASIEEKEVTVYGEKQKSTLERQKLSQQDIKNMPNLYSDALRSVQILPGVTSNNELSSSYNVRGGNFDENLMYLNGFQIYRPFLLKQGVEENQTLINPAMLKDMQFYAGGFPARLGDKMSSALELTYNNKFQDSLHGNFRSDLLNLAASINQHIKDLDYSIGIRYAYPGMFLNKLHTTGSYLPFFADIQALINFGLSPSSNLELLIIYANNRFEFSPYEFQGNFQQAIPQKDNLPLKYIRGIKVDFTGTNEYKFSTKLAGLKYQKQFSEELEFALWLSTYVSNETEFCNTSSNIFYTEDPEFQAYADYEYLKSKIQKADNGLDFNSNDLGTAIKLKHENHRFDIGFNTNLTKIRNRLNETSFEISSTYLTDFPSIRQINTDLNFFSYYFYAQDEILINENIKINLGGRFLDYRFTGEKLFSPRTAIYYYPSKKHTLNFSWGYYYQPPLYFELSNKINPDEISLKSQKAIFYVLGWDYLFKEKVKFQIQTYYKALDNLIPYYIEQLKLEYEDKNNMEGYAYGVDVQFQGEITKDVQSWIGYSYLNSKERYKTTGSSYQRRFLDQRHTIQIFLQDKFPKHPNWQSHLRIIFGSGFLYPERKASIDSLTGKQYVTAVMDLRDEFPFYMRADMGLTANFHIFERYELRILAEVLNVFNKQNIANYIWVQTFRDIRQPVWVPQMYSERFFNMGIEINF